MITIKQKIQCGHDFLHKNAYDLIPYLIDDNKDHPYVIICPGGGYRMVCNFMEGKDFALEFNKRGYNAFVLFYRINKKATFPNPQDDLARAIKETHENKEKYHLTDKYFLIGSSAGGHLCASMGTESIGYKKYNLPRPNGIILVYPVITMDKDVHEGSKNRHIGKNPSDELVNLCSIERQVTDCFPPTYIWCGDKDESVPPVNSILMDKALTNHNIKHVFKIYENVGHGVGLGNNTPCANWIKEAIDFIDNL